jgi:hypothetical protein
MRATRGFLATFGASTSLMLVGALGLFTVSAMVAFKHWPGVSTPGVDVQSALLMRNASVTNARDRQAVVMPAPSRKHSHAGDGAQQFGSTAIHSTPVQSHVPPIGRRTEPVQKAGAPASALPKPTAKAPLVPQAGEGVRKLGGGVGDSVTNTGSKLGQTVRPLSPTLADTVDHVTAGVGGTVQTITGVIGDLLDQLGTSG